MLILSLLVGTTAVSVVIAGLLALLRNNKSSQNRWFFFLTITVGFWITANFIDSNVVDSDWTVIFLKADFASALFIAWALVEFTNVFIPRSKWTIAGESNTLVRYGGLLTNIAVVTATIFGFVIAGSVRNDELNVEYRILFVPYLCILLLYFGYAVLQLLMKRAHTQGQDKQSVNTIFVGLLIALVANIFTNIVSPLLFSNRNVVQGLNILGYLGLLAFVVAIYIAITRQKLFDIRLVVARSFGYLISLILIAVIYGFVVFGAARTVFDLEYSIGALLFLSIATGILGLSFQRFRHTFDKVTQRIFFRDSYDPQEMYSQLNQILVSSLDVRYLMMQSLSIIETALKPDFVAVGLRKQDGEMRLFSSKHLNLTPGELLELGALSGASRRKVLLTDDLDSVKLHNLRSMLQKKNIAALIQLRQTNRAQSEGLGYLLLGTKKSGNPYTTQDAKVLDTVANELIIAIQNALHYEEIQQFNLSLQAKVDEATRKLRSNNEKLKALDETKDDFISMASHQLRTPLTSVKGYLSMVLEGDAGEINETQAKMLSQAYTSSQRMVYLIADLLNVSRLKTGKFVIDAAPTDLSQMINEEIGQLTEAATSRSLTLSYKQPETFPSLMLDETKTRQVLMNFIDNAIYYTPKGGHITIELKDTGPTVEFRVIDDGIGVPKAEQHHLFTKFYRAGNARQARPDGTGLGLFMAKKVISAQHGSLIFDSKEGKGSTFGFIFAKAKLHAPEPTTL